ncbi:MAG TPA: hypothetical protein VFW03_15380, partial [Gemmatimonadaceae bacterium]|nr:hypothetical protein [Gemmatimonadaceae bacterium]
MHCGHNVECADRRGNEPSAELNRERAVDAGRTAAGKPERQQGRHHGADAREHRAESRSSGFDERHASVQVVSPAVPVRGDELSAVPNDD